MGNISLRPEELFEKAFATKLNYSLLSWLPPLSSLITFDHKFQIIELSADFLDEDQIEKFLDLNFVWNKSGVEPLRLSKNSNGKISLTFSFADLEKLADTEIDEYRHNLQYMIQNNYYRDFNSFQLKSIAKSALNLDYDLQKNKKDDWEFNGFAFDWVWKQKDSGPKESDLMLFFCMAQTPQVPVSGYGHLTKSLEAYISRVTTFLEGSEFLTDTQKSAIEAGLLNDINYDLIMHIATTSGGHYHPAINLEIASRMRDCGIQIDLMPFIDKHYSRFDFENRHRSEHEDAEKAFKKIFGVNSETLETKSTSISCNPSGGTFDSKTGNRVDYKTGEPEDEEPMHIDISFRDISREEYFSITAEFNDVCGDHYFELIDIKHPLIRIPFATVESCIEQGKRFDLTPVFANAGNLHISRTQRAKENLEKLSQTTACPWISSRISFLDDNKYSKASMRLEKWVRTTADDFPDPHCLYTPTAVEVENLLNEHGLSDIFKIFYGAGRLAGGMTSHHFWLDASIKSIDDTAKLADLLEPLSDRLKPLIAALIGQSSMLNREYIQTALLGTAPSLPAPIVE